MPHSCKSNSPEDRARKLTPHLVKQPRSGLLRNGDEAIFSPDGSVVGNGVTNVSRDGLSRHVAQAADLAQSSALPKIIVGSGWWCADAPHAWSIGASDTRSVAFFDLWYRQVMLCLAPQRIIVTDSAAPVKPNIAAYDRLEWVELDSNYGHANDIRTGVIRTGYSGFTRAFINGAVYALFCDADYYVFVEQDCLLVGEGLLQHALGDETADILVGQPTKGGVGLDGGPAAQMLQQSFVIVRRSGLVRFITGLLGSPWTDGEKSPEEIMRLQLAPLGNVQIPYGRSRPIDFGRSHFYAQHLSEAELVALQHRLDGPRTVAGTTSSDAN